jgi:hypothetical protein
MKAAIVLAIIVLAGCQTDPGKAETISWLQSQGMDEGSAIVLASNKPALRRYILDRTQAPQDDAYCRSLGARQGSDAYVQCRTSVSASRPVNDPPVVINQSAPAQKTVYVQQQQPWPQSQQQPVYQPAPGAALMGAGRDAYCARVPGNC